MTTLTEFLKSMETSVQLAKKLEIDDVELLNTLYKTIFTTDKVIYIETLRDKYRLDHSSVQAYAWLFDIYEIGKKMENPQEDDGSKQMMKIFKQILENANKLHYEEDFIFNEMIKYPGNEKYLFLIKRRDEHGSFVQSYKMTKNFPYHKRNGINIRVDYDPKHTLDVLPNINRELIEPYFITSYRVFNDGTKISPSYEEETFTDGKGFLIDGNMVSRDTYYNDLVDLNTRFRREYRNLHDFLISEGDDVYCIYVPDMDTHKEYNIMDYEG